MRKVVRELPGEAGRKLGNVYVFKTAETTRATPTNSSNQHTPIDTGSDREGPQRPQKSLFWPSLRSPDSIESLKINADVQDQVRASPSSNPQDHTVKSDDAIPSFFTRVENIERELPSPALAGSALEAVAARISAARTSLLQKKQKAFTFYNRYNDALFSTAGLVVGIAILGIDLGSNVSLATEQRILVATQVKSVASSEWKSQAAIQPQLDGPQHNPVFSDSRAAAIIAHKPDATISSKIDFNEVPFKKFPTENGQALVAQLSGPEMTLHPASVENIAKAQAPAERLDVINAIDLPDALPPANSGGTTAAKIVTFKSASAVKSAYVQKIRQKSATLRKAIVKAASATVHRVLVPKRNKVATAPVERTASALRTKHPISKLGANAIALAKKKSAPVAKPIAASPAGTPYVAVRTLDEAMALQYSSK